MEQVTPNRRVLVLTGPTASGKTAVGVRIAGLLRGEIISADSRQVFREISIGTAKPGPEEQQGILHHFIDCVGLADRYTAGAYAREAASRIEDLFARGIQPIVAGGSGLYIQALVEGIFEGPGQDPALRAGLERRYEEEGIGAIWSELLALDPESAEFVPKTNIPRVIRALEVCLLSGEAYSKIRKERMVEPAFSAAFYGIDWNRSVLYQRINDRVHSMLAAGLVEEVQRLKAESADPRWQSLNTVGYKEVFAFLDGKIGRDEMIEQIQQHTRNYAKRQLTWFRKKQDIQWIQASEPLDVEGIALEIVNNFRNRALKHAREE